LKVKDGIADVASMLSYFGVKCSLDDWNDVVKTFRIIELERRGAIAVARNLFGRHSEGNLVLNDESIADSMKTLYMFIVHNSFRNLANLCDTQNFCPGEYENIRANRYVLADFNESKHEMLNNMKTALSALINGREKFNLQREHFEALQGFESFVKDFIYPKTFVEEAIQSKAAV